jgi:hypothetical protein
LQKKGELSVFPVAGSAGHAALDEYWRTGSLAPALGKLQEVWENEGGGVFDVSGESLNLVHMKNVVSNYINRYKKDAYEPIWLADALGDGHIASEAEVSVQFEGVKLPVKMILDRVMRHVHTGRLEIWDSKFVASQLTPYSQWSPPPDEKYMLSYQIPLYAAGWRKLTGLDIQAGKIEAIYMGTNDRRAHPGEVRPITIFDRWDEEIAESAIQFAKDRIAEIEWRRESGVWPQIDGSLERQYICWRCSYRSLCEAKPSAREGLIQLHYEEKV